MSSSDSSILVDDSDPHVQYKPGWIWQQGLTEVDGTRHGAGEAGLTASLAFTGSGIQVVGTLGPLSTSGQPKTSYAIDGDVVGTYNASVGPGAASHYNVTFFSTSNLAPGDHELVITNVDGTTPNIFWLDYFLIDTSTKASTGPEFPATTSGTTSSSTKAPPRTGATQSSPSESAQSLTSGTPTSSADSSSRSTNVGIIVGPVVAGIVVLAVIGTLVFCLLRQRRRLAERVVPFDTPPNPRELPTSRSATLLAPKDRSHLSTTSYGTTLPHSEPSVATGARAPAQTRSAPSAPPSDSESIPSASDPHIPPAPSTTTPSTVSPIRRTRPITQAIPSPMAEKPTSPPRSSYTESQPHFAAAPPESPAVLTPDSATFLTTPPPSIPPGWWHAPPGTHSRAQSLIQAVFSRGPRRNARSANPGPPPVHDIDSGLRLYDTPILPPPYTQD